MKISNNESSIVYNKSPLLNSYKIKKALVPWLFLLPGLLVTLVLRYYTIFQGIKLSFYKYDVANPPGQFVGLRNFKNVFANPDYWQAWKNTFAFLILIFLLNFFIPLIQAIFLSEVIKLRSILTTLYILPAVVPVTINIVLWKWIWHPDYGIANFIIKFFGGEPQLWLSDVKWVKFCIVFPGVIGGGIGVLLYLAAILGISAEMKEAAELDGCTGFSRIFRITLPNIKFLILIMFVLSTMNALQYMDMPFQFTNGGPAGASTTIPLLVYHFFSQNYDYGQGSAAAMTLMVVVSIITFIQLKLDKQESE